MFRRSSSIRFLPFLALLFCLSPLPLAQAAVFDMTAGWSDQTNPNGPWSYCYGQDPLPSVYRQSDSWGEPQISWGDLPGWFRSNGTELFEHDWIEGDVITHCPSEGEGYCDVAFTSPSAGFVSITGATWPCRDIGRWVLWEITVDGMSITSGVTGSDDPYSRAQPMDFTQGTGGPSVLLDIPVQAGSRIELRASQYAGYYGDYAGYRMSVNLEETPVPAEGTSWGRIKEIYR
jgi:hypothetical protein